MTETLWQPREEAPVREDGRHGPRIIVWVCVSGDKRKGIAEFGYACRSHSGEIVLMAEGYNGKWEIEHWMPAPPAPVAC